MAVSRDRLARNQVLFRAVNERVREVLDESVGPAEFLCECRSEDCIETLTIPLAEYERIRARSNLFFVAPGHEILTIERVTEETEAYKLVEKMDKPQAQGSRRDVPAH